MPNVGIKNNIPHVGLQRNQQGTHVENTIPVSRIEGVGPYLEYSITYNETTLDYNDINTEYNGTIIKTISSNFSPTVRISSQPNHVGIRNVY